MKMNFETTVGSVGGSKTTVIPSIVSKLLEIEKGNKLIWEAKIEDNEIVITLKKSQKLQES